MGDLQTIHFYRELEAPIERVFDHFADHHWFVSLFGGYCRKVAEGQDHPNGVGSVRRIGYGPLSMDESIVAFVPNERIEYTVSRGPLRNHLGQIEFRVEAGKTVVDYHIRFEGQPAFAGPWVKRLVVGVWKVFSPKRFAAL